jgi:diguanylate cyclase (GGDEF)-like protein
MFDALGHGRGLRPFAFVMAIFMLGNVGLAASGGAGWLIAAIAAANIALAGVAVGRRLAIRDLPGRDRALRRIEHLASHDTLTDLSNRAHFSDALDDAIDARKPFALLALDLDRFKAVNDLFGHGAGDAILCRVADMLRAAVRGTDIVARVGGDEFLIIQTGISGPDDARKLANRILDTVSIEMDRARDPMAVGVSIGVALYPRDGASVDAMLQGAEAAMRSARQQACGVAMAEALCIPLRGETATDIG